MGIQDVQDVTLIRHAYVQTAHRSRGIGGRLLAELQTDGPAGVDRHLGRRHLGSPVLEKRGFRLVTPEEKNRLLKKYWSIPDRQVETSVVLGDAKWWTLHPDEAAAEAVVAS